MKIRLTKAQVKEVVNKNAPDYLELFNDFHVHDGGWLIWPEPLVKIKSNLKLENYVELYEDEKRINICFALYMFDKDQLEKQAEEEKGLTLEQKQEKLNALVEYIDHYVEDELPQMFKDFPIIPENEKLAKEEFEKLSIEDQQYFTRKFQYLFLGMLSAMHNYFAVMVLGEKMTSLVPKALKGDDDAFLKAVKIDRNLLTNHTYFKDRYQKAQQSGQREFLEKLAIRQSTPNLLSKIRYPGVYFIFSMLEVMGWLDEFRHEEILDLCDTCGLDRWQNRIEDVNAVTKQLLRYRRYQKTGGVSMH
jgi:hypothetical protein